MAGKIGVNLGEEFWNNIKDEIIDLYVNKNISVSKLAEKYNCSNPTIRNHLKKWGVYQKDKSCKKVNEYQDCGDYVIGYTRSEKYEFYIDKEYYDVIKKYCWHKHQDGYLRTCIGKNENGRNIYKLMHVMIMEAFGKVWSNDEEIDHINGKPNDNKLCNLRIVSHCNNMKNHKIMSNNKSGHSGVYYSKSEKKWKATININGKQVHLGTFDSKSDAVAMREYYETKHYGEYLRNKNYLYNGIETTCTT